MKDFKEQYSLPQQRDIRAWEEEGFSTMEIRYWHDLGFYNAEEAAKWRDLFLNEGWELQYIPNMAKEWAIDYGFSFDEAEEWVKRGIYSAYNAKRWKDSGFTPMEAQEWKKVWEKYPMAIEELKEWKDAGYSAKEALELWRSGYREPEDVPEEKQEQKSFLGGDNMTRWDNLSPEKQKEWRDIWGFEPEEAEKWLEMGMQAMQAAEWRQADFTPEEAKKWWDAGFTLAKDAAEWRDGVEAGWITFEDAVNWFRHGFDLDQAIAWTTLGIHDAYMIKKLGYKIVSEREIHEQNEEPEGDNPPKGVYTMAKEAGVSKEDAERYWREAEESCWDAGHRGEALYRCAMAVTRRRMGLEPYPKRAERVAIGPVQAKSHIVEIRFDTPKELESAMKELEDKKDIIHISKKTPTTLEVEVCTPYALEAEEIVADALKDFEFYKPGEIPSKE